MLDEIDSRPSSPLVLLKPGANETPLFITHGLGGDVLELVPLVEKIRTDRPIYGLQWKGLKRGETPDRSIGEMAEYFMDAIIRLQPHGPYLFAGFSVGGLPMLEMADRLSKCGETIALLALLDSYPHARYWPAAAWIGVLLKRVEHHIAALAEMRVQLIIPYVFKLCEGFMGHVRSRRGAAPNWVNNTITSSPGLQRLRDSSLEAVARYRPPYYQGKITFFRAEGLTSFPKDPAKIWGKLTAEFEMYSLPCNHVDMVGARADVTATTLSLCIKQALKTPKAAPGATQGARS